MTLQRRVNIVNVAKIMKPDIYHVLPLLYIMIFCFGYFCWNSYAQTTYTKRTKEFVQYLSGAVFSSFEYQVLDRGFEPRSGHLHLC